MKSNSIKINYLKNGNISIKIDREKNIEFKTDFLLYENVLDALGNIDIVTCNEINGNEPDMLIDRLLIAIEIFSFYKQNKYLN